MDVLIRKSNSAVVKMWPNGTGGRIAHPDAAGALTPGAGTARPLDFGDFILVTATVENESFNETFQTRTGPAYTVGEDFATTATYTVSYKSLADCKAAKLAQVNELRDQKRYPTALVTGLGWNADLRDDTDEKNIRGKVMLALSRQIDSNTSAIEFMGADNEARDLTPAQMVTVGRAMDTHITGVYARSWVHKSAIAALTTAAAVDAYDITTGW